LDSSNANIKETFEAYPAKRANSIMLYVIPIKQIAKAGIARKSKTKAISNSLEHWKTDRIIANVAPDGRINKEILCRGTKKEQKSTEPQKRIV